MPNKQKKRFIAGAKCPKCHSMDTLMLYMLNNVENVECVRCGHHQAQVETEVEEQTRTSENVIGVFKPE